MIELIDDMKSAINNAMADGCPMVLAYVDETGQPSLSFRGSTQTHRNDSLAIWVRNPEGGLLRAIGNNPKIAMLYRNPQTRTAWMFQGRARLDEDPQIRDEVYTSAPEVERNMDLERKGQALVIALDRVMARGQVLMQRDD